MPYIHHLATHFPIALASLAAALSIYAWVRKSTEWERVAAIIAQLGALSALVAAVTGLLSASHIIEGGVAPAIVELHRNVALAGTGLLIVAAIASYVAVRASKRAESEGRSGSPARLAGALMLIAATAVGAGAHFGGEMLHPGMAPWSNKPHSHGMPGMPGMTGDPHGHGGDGADGHDEGAGDGHAHAHGDDQGAADHGAMADAGIADASAVDAALDGGGTPDSGRHAGMPGMGTAQSATATAPKVPTARPPASPAPPPVAPPSSTAMPDMPGMPGMPAMAPPPSAPPPHGAPGHTH
jgi:uncharacterized membrane protein